MKGYVMFERFRGRASSPQVLGVVLVVVGLLMFVAVFLAAFPVLSDPVGAYDEWFPQEEEAAAEVVVEEVEAPAGPTAAFRYVAEAVFEEPEEESEVEPAATYSVAFEDRSEPGDAAIVAWTWDFGDGEESDRPRAEHRYEGPGAYQVRLEVQDENGEVGNVEGDIEVPEEGRNSDRIEDDSLDLSGIESAVEDAVVALEGSVDDTLGTVRDTSRNMGVVTLFALAAIATTVVAWRLTRSGVMLLRPAQEMRLKVKSADMHVDIGKETLVEAVNVAADEPQVSQDADEAPAALIEV